MSVKNYHVHSTDQEYLERIAEDYVYMGREIQLTEGHLVVFSRKVKPVKKKAVDKKPRRDVESEDRPQREQRPKRRE